ncbi:MAG: GNAT family N-acetyltransferase [Rhizobiaceae bacterium]|nr:GNAT family N-acetyltransferase [Rhizobiaceae bacterium]
MTTPPTRYPPLPVGRQIALLRARDMPLHFYRYLQDRVGRDWTWVNALRMSDEELSGRVHAAERDLRVLYLDGAPAGFFELSTKPLPRVEIAYFGMMGHVTGQGLGRWFLGAAIEAAWSYKPEAVFLSTCTEDHPAALPLYQKMGFSPVAQSKETLVPLTKAERATLVMR